MCGKKRPNHLILRLVIEYYSHNQTKLSTFTHKNLRIYTPIHLIVTLRNYTILIVIRSEYFILRKQVHDLISYFIYVISQLENGAFDLIEVFFMLCSVRPTDTYALKMRQMQLENLKILISKKLLNLRSFCNGNVGSVV